ncbi:AAA family ATPase [Thermococcus gammatolerans]|uniref:Prokaryotic ATPase, AAA superfamily n=1 Tax=Thermococcus gammatolerans (strain DSM 15229 / JCM 11827 / EJ3) TaxID=593117 RepID=C5A7A9_THEGJ|nr:ATP-binding protein [Thermococcus gammatolerans]ACS34121.1 Prokaryotic ATPase, AAA superfamily [Thermococcus gammatolerans EJ3]
MRGVFQEDDRKTTDNLFGRDEEIQNILSKLITRDPVFIVGYRRVGKSSLAHAVSNLIVGDHFAHVYCESGFNNTGDIINRVKDTLNSKIETRTKSFVVGKLIEIGLSKTKADRLIQEFENSTIIILDEAQRVTNSGIIDDFLTWVTKHLGSTTRVIITGSEVRLLHGLFKRIHGNPNRIITIYPFEQKVATDFILKGFEQNDFPISREEAKEIYSTLGGTPGAIIAAAEHIILEGEDIDTATEREKTTEMKMMIEELNNIASEYTVETQSFVKKLSINEWQIYDLSFFTEDEKKLLEDLIRFGFIKPNEKGYIVYDPLIREALKEWGGVI